MNSSAYHPLSFLLIMSLVLLAMVYGYYIIKGLETILRKIGKEIWYLVYKKYPKWVEGKFRDIGESLNFFFVLTGTLIVWLLLVLINMFI